MASKISLVIAAGGIGSRFQKGLSRGKQRESKTKLFHLLDGQPVLFHSIRAFDDVPQVEEIVLAVPAEAKSEIRRLTRGWSKHPLKVVSGGGTRAESVFNAIKQSKPENSLVMIHDAARPLIAPQSIKQLIRAFKDTDGLLLVSPVAATVKQTLSHSVRVEKTLDRDRLFTAETPQLANRRVLLDAYKQKNALSATDEAGLLESAGARVKIMTHDSWNPKITTLKDLALAEAYLQLLKPQPVIKTGLGQDLHRLAAGRKLYLGGLHIPYNKGALGHSDGDVVLHAVTDAVLGVMGAGDIGDWFSDKDKRFKNIRSEKLLKKVMAAAAKEKWRIVHVDVVITLQKPKLGNYKIKIKQNLAHLLEVPAEDVSIKAKTAEGLGPEGREEALSCQALITMKKESI